tara:strand:+ start:3320 stop:4147 length:828 start_codon:yes stop_codon:yes gene_type:complete
MKVKHNKKRNTAFVYEALIREATVAILKNEHKKKEKVVSLIKKHFHGNSLLKKDLECYRSLYENQKLDQNISEKILREARLQKRLIDPEGLFKQQTGLIHDINKDLSSDVFNNFVPNYKTLATIDQIFSTKISPKNRVILENEIINDMKNEEKQNEISAVDNITYRTFVKKFNEKYENDLLSEQKNLLTHYIASFSDNALELKIFLNDEIGRLKTKLSEAKETDEIKNDNDMRTKTDEVIGRLNSFAKETVTERVLLTVLRTQSLVEEIYNGDNN